MNKKIFLTSAICMCMALPAFAEEFPSNGLMQEDTTYDNAATYANLGTYSGTVTANASYQDIQYQIESSCYIPAGTDPADGYDNGEYDTCPAFCLPGSYCPGGTFTYNAGVNQGINACSGLGDGSYTLSNDDTSSAEYCYRNCTVSDLRDTHATSAGGEYYYGGSNSCIPTACENGYHVQAAVDAPDLISILGHRQGTGYIVRKLDGTYCNDDEGCLPDEDWEDEGLLADFQALGLSNGGFLNTYDSGEVRGIAQCSTQGGTGPWNGAGSSASLVSTRASLPDNSGQNCWCKATGWVASGTSVVQRLTASWAILKEYNDAGTCAQQCATDCEDTILRDSPGKAVALRDAVFGAVEPTPAMCVGNTINITWSDASADDVAANNAGQCTFGEAIRTPRAATAKTGKRFLGWTFQKSGN